MRVILAMRYSVGSRVEGGYVPPIERTLASVA